MSQIPPTPSGPSNPPRPPIPPRQSIRQETSLAWFGGIAAITATALSVGATIYQSGKHSERMENLSERIQSVEEIGDNYRKIQTSVANLETKLEEQRVRIDSVSAREESGNAAFEEYSIAAKATFDQFQDILDQIRLEVGELKRISPIEQQCTELMVEARNYSSFSARGSSPDSNPHIFNFNAFKCDELITAN